VELNITIPDEALESRGRQDWRTLTRSSKLRRGAQAWANYHDARLAHWQEERAALEDKARAEGVELREQQVTGGSQFIAQLNQALASQLSTAVKKCEEHQRSRDEFEAWALFFTEAGEDQGFHCSASDLRYFLAGPPEAEA